MDKFNSRRHKIAIIGTVGLPAKYGGWETLVDNIIEPMTDIYDVTVICSGMRYEQKQDKFKGAKLRYINLNANGIQSIPYDILSMWQTRQFDHVLILGTSGCIVLPFFRMLFCPRYHLNIDGIEWRRDKWSKPVQLFLRLSERFGVYSAHQLISDNAVIQAHIKKAYSKDSALIPYGGDSAVIPKKVCSDLADVPYAFSVCRIEPENNIHVILDAYAKMPENHLVIIGNWEANSYGKQLKTHYNDTANISIIDPIYDRAILDSYRANCTLYLHGHSAGGTNPSLVEAMWLGLPVVAFDVDFNRETTEKKARYFKSSEELISIVNELGDQELTDIRNAMKEVADRRYTWAKVSAQYKALFT